MDSKQEKPDLTKYWVFLITVLILFFTIYNVMINLNFVFFIAALVMTICIVIMIAFIVALLEKHDESRGNIAETDGFCKNCVEEQLQREGLMEEGLMDLKKEEQDPNKKCLISVENWVIILDNEISNLGYPDFAEVSNPLLIFWIAFIGFMIASIGTTLQSLFSSILHPIWIMSSVIIIIGVIAFSINFCNTYKKTNDFNRIKHKIIFGELTDSNKIREEWKKVVDSSNPIYNFFRRILPCS